MADRMRVTSLMRPRITSPGRAVQHGVTREAAGHKPARVRVPRPGRVPSAFPPRRPEKGTSYIMGGSLCDIHCAWLARERQAAAQPDVQGKNKYRPPAGVLEP